MTGTNRILQADSRRFNRKAYALFFDYLLLMAMFCNYFEPVTIWYGAFFLLVVALFFLNTRFIKAFFKHYIIIITGAVFLTISIIISNSNEFLATNLLNLITPTAVCLCMSGLMIWKKDEFKALLLARVKILNIWWVINLLILAVQEMGYPLFIKSQWLDRNPFYDDLCCGLFGYNRTHELAFFSCMILVCNLHYYSIKRKKGFLVYTIISEAAMLIMSYFNDNTAFFLLLPFVLLMYLILNDAKRKTGITRKVIKYFKYVVLVILAIFLLIQIPSINKVYNDYIQVRINAILFYQQWGVAGSNERAAIVEYAFQQPGVWRFGSGIGAELLGEHFAHGFRHFGLSSMGIVISLVGFWYYLVHTSLLSLCCVDLIMVEEKKDLLFSFAVIAVFILIASFYSPIMTSTASILWITVMFAYI